MGLSQTLLQTKADRIREKLALHTGGAYKRECGLMTGFLTSFVFLAMNLRRRIIREGVLISWRFYDTTTTDQR